MTLSFTQQIKGKPNLFIDKIWYGLENIIAHGDYTYVPEEMSTWEFYRNKHIDKFGKPWEEAFGSTPKIHTIREDKSNRWRAGMDIHPVINNRTPNRFQFAPSIKCVSVQKIEIKSFEPHTDKKWVYVDEKLISKEKVKELAINDGFDSVEDFFAYFNKDFRGVLIHWTNKKY